MMMVIGRSGDIHKYSSEEEFNSSPDVIPELAIYAKRIDNRFFVLASENGDLFDVNDSSYYRIKKSTGKGKLFFNLETCKEETYKLYTRYLRSKNLVDLHCARRSYLNG